MATLAGFDGGAWRSGWDEAFLAADTDGPGGAGPPGSRTALRVVTSLECTVGIGENKLQAKLAAGFGKPAGIFRLTHESWSTVLGDHPTHSVEWGQDGQAARRPGLHTVADLAATDPRHLAAHLAPVTGPWLVQTARGLSPTPVDAAPYVPRSHGQEITFQHDLTDWEQVRNEVARLARR